MSESKDPFAKWLPKWKAPASLTTSHGGERMLVYRNEAEAKERTVTVRDDDGRTYRLTPPAVRYERAVHPNGHIVPLGCSTSRADPHPECNYELLKVMKEKVEIDGFLLVDKKPPHVATLEEWQAHCLQEMERRQAAHAKRSEDASRAWRSSLEILNEANQGSLKEVVGEFMRAMKEQNAPRKGRDGIA